MKTLTVCSVLLTSVSSALLWGNQTQCRLPPTNTRHLQKEVAQKIHQSQLHHRPVARWTFCRWQTKLLFFLIYGLLNRGGPVQEKCQFLRPIWSQWFPERTMRDIRQGSIIKYCLTWFNNKFLQESIIWEKVVQLKFCVLVTPPLLLDSIHQKRKQPNN